MYNYTSRRAGEANCPAANRDWKSETHSFYEPVSLLAIQKKCPYLFSRH